MEPIHDPDLEALGRCRAGDSSAFAELVDRHKDAVYRWVYSWVGRKESAEELAQDVFLNAFRNLGNFRGDSKFSTWLHQIALNRCRDHWRSRQRKPESLVEEEYLARVESPRASSEVSAVARQEAEALRSAMAELPDIYREALSLRFFGDLPYEEIAAMLGENLSNVKMRVMRGLAQLRRKWKGEARP
ncbi:MAG TPA: RNA polymerase sigma factor [bacterium]|nr:RNA polymerase sigma factor [bacterium]